jgi:hypothetical protein
MCLGCQHTRQQCSHYKQHSTLQRSSARRTPGCSYCQGKGSRRIQHKVQSYACIAVQGTAIHSTAIWCTALQRTATDLMYIQVQYQHLLYRLLLQQYSSCVCQVVQDAKPRACVCIRMVCAACTHSHTQQCTVT